MWSWARMEMSSASGSHGVLQPELFSSRGETGEWGSTSLTRKPDVMRTSPEQKSLLRASLVGQWLRIHLPVQGKWVRALGREDPTYCGATKPVCHNY